MSDPETNRVAINALKSLRTELIEEVEENTKDLNRAKKDLAAYQEQVDKLDLGIIKHLDRIHGINRAIEAMGGDPRSN
jgi:ribosome recycling factor